MSTSGWRLRYVKAPPAWSPTDPNPFAADGHYGSGWSCFCLLDREDDQILTGQSGDGPFSARFGRRVGYLENRLVDFLRYESAAGRTVILSFPEDVDVDDFVARALSCTPEPRVVRPYDPQIVVHSTPLQAWRSISADGALKAASELGLAREGDPETRPLTEVERYYRNEPPEYGEYIMFSGMESPVSELVLASNRAGRFVLDERAQYEPGVRLYFDNHRIIADGLGVRDGLHVTKVHRRLPLRHYLLAAVSVDDVAPNEAGTWTPRTFTESANAVFARLFTGAGLAFGRKPGTIHCQSPAERGKGLT